MKFSKISGVSVFLFRAIELKSMWQISWKILVYFVLGQVKSFKIKYLAYQRESLRVWQVKFKVLKDLKLSSISDFCYELQSQFKKTETTGKWQSGWILNFLSGVSFLRLLMLIIFFAENSFFNLAQHYFPVFPVFPAIPSNQLGHFQYAIYFWSFCFEIAIALKVDRLLWNFFLKLFVLIKNLSSEKFLYAQNVPSYPWININNDHKCLTNLQCLTIVFN